MMNIMTALGLFVAAAAGIVDRMIFTLPDWLATVLYAAAAILIIAGMRRTGRSA